ATEAGGTVYSYTLPTANDLEEGPVPVVADFPPGSHFPLGTTVVHFTAEDSQHKTAFTSFTVTVKAAPATHFLVQAAATALVNSPASIVVTARDPYENVDSAYAGSVHLTSTDGAASLDADSTLTTGTHTFTATFQTAGPQTVTATDTATAI